MKAPAPPTSSTQEQALARLIRRLGLACVTTAVVSSILLGLWEIAQPVFSGLRYTLTAASALQLSAYAVLQAIKPAGFLAGLYGLFLVATRRGKVLQLVMMLAAAGGAWFAVVWIMIAATGRDKRLKLTKR